MGRLNATANMLTDEQNKIVENIFAYRDDAELSDDDINELAKMFSSSKRFVLLRKMLQLYTIQERGLFHVSNLAPIQGQSFEEIGRNVVIERAVDERIRIALARVFITVRDKKRSDKTDEFTKLNEYNEAQKEQKEKSVLGKNL